MTADAFSIILDFLYSGRLALSRDNVIEVMSAASYLQMTDLVSFCKGYIRSSLEICNREKEKEKDSTEKGGGEGPADSGTPALPPSGTSGVGESHSQVTEADRGPSLGRDLMASASIPSSVPLATPPGPSRDTESDCSSRGDFPSVSGGQNGHIDQTNPSSSSSSGLTLDLVNPKIEYDPDEELEGSPDTKDLALYPGPPLQHPHHSRLLPPSPSRSNERAFLGYGSFNARQFMEVLARGGGSSPLRDRGEQSQLFPHGLGPGAGGGRVDEGLGLGGSSIMEIQTDWFGEETGN